MAQNQMGEVPPSLTASGGTLSPHRNCKPPSPAVSLPLATSILRMRDADKSIQASVSYYTLLPKKLLACDHSSFVYLLCLATTCASIQRKLCVPH